MAEGITIFWFRRDLRLVDNRGLYEALKQSYRVLPLFIFDEDILAELPHNDHRVEFIYNALQQINVSLQEKGKAMLLRKGRPHEVFSQLLNEFSVDSVFCNGDHEPYGIKRDEGIESLLNKHGVRFQVFLDHLVFGKNEILKPDGLPYWVFTPYSRRWKASIHMQHLRHFPSEELLEHLYALDSPLFPSLQQFGFRPSGMPLPEYDFSENLIRHYDQTRDFPAAKGTSRVGVHLRFGTLSIRNLVNKALQWNDVFLNELIWREFYATILWHYPDVMHKSFKPEYERIEWRNDETEFERWKAGTTGYPMVDAGMRELNATAYMHNRLRMITASFLSKHLLIDWRWGEAYFAQRLFDYEASSNNGGWQWSAGTGCDAAPYFRIFNPAEQQRKYDPHVSYIRAWIPELDDRSYPEPMIDHRMARERCLRVYKQALRPGS